jgi:hypothetical protein
MKMFKTGLACLKTCGSPLSVFAFCGKHGSIILDFCAKVNEKGQKN